MATTGNPLLPQGFTGIGGALQAAAPMFLSMAQGFRQGNPYAYLDQGLAQMVAAQKEKAGETAFQEALGMPGTQPGQFSMVTGPQGTQPASPVAGAFQGAAAASGQFPQSLIRTESGGNWNALNKEGYGGRLQFGQARLADAARAGIIPAGMTGAAFSQLPPEQQMAVENWHFADIDQQAKARGLDKYIGQNIGGTTVTQDGIRAMAHLGGIGGAARFLESGGQYNPADSNSTSLGDYLRTHAGGGQAQPQQQAPRRDINRLYEAYANPNMSPDRRAVIGMLIEQEQARNAPVDPLKQVQLQTAQLQLEQMRNPAAPKPMEINGQLVDPTTGQVLGDYRTDERYRPLSREEAVQMGLPDGAYQIGPDDKISQIGGGGVNVSVGNGTNPELGKLSTDYTYATNPDGSLRRDERGLPLAVPVPGSPAARDLAAAAQKQSTTQTMSQRQNTIVRDDIRRAREQAKGAFTTGLFGAATQNIPGSAGYDLRSTLDTVKANIGFDRLQAMRDSSPTGGALGSVTENELRMLQAVMGSIEQSQSQEQLDQNLARLETVYTDIMRKAAAYPNAAEFGFGVAESNEQAGGQWQDMGNGVQIRALD